MIKIKTEWGITMKRKMCAVLAVGAMLFALLLNGCEKTEKGTENQVNNANDIIISTQYGDLYYPDQWTEFVKTEQKSENDVVVVSFGAEINSKVYPLFEVMIGGEGANSVGTLTDSAGTKHDVYLQLEEIQEDPNLNDGEQNRLYAMQEDLNYLIDNLK